MQYSQNNKQINIIFSADNKYVQHLGVTLCSIFENKSNNSDLNIFVIDGGISNKNIAKLQILEKKYSFKIKYIHLQNNDYKDLLISRHITQATYYRILIPNIVEQKISKILYLDCDLVVLGDLKELYEIDINNFLTAATEEHVSGEIKLKLGIRIEAPYFNAGVLLINTEKWRNVSVTDKTLRFIREKPEKITFWDQDALNANIKDGCRIIDKKYNLTTLEIERMSSEDLTRMTTPLIVHYSSSIKPWKFNGYHPFNDNYFYYLKKTPWNNKLYNNWYMRLILAKINNAKYGMIKIIKKIIKYG